MNKNDFEKIIEGIVDEGDIVSKDDLEIVDDDEAETLEVDEYYEDFTTIEQARKRLKEVSSKGTPFILNFNFPRVPEEDDED